jgi:hypothetical protein
MATLRIHGSKPHTCKKFPLEQKIPRCSAAGIFYYPVKFIGFTGKKQSSYLPETTKRLLFNCFFASVKSAAKADRG